MVQTKWGRLLATVALLIFLDVIPAHAQPHVRAGGAPGQPYLAWALTPEGAPYLLDARYILWELDAANLAPVRRPHPLQPAMGWTAVRWQTTGPDPYGMLVSTDDQRTWTPNLALNYPNDAGVDGLSISPTFAADGTIVASAAYTSTRFRSTDWGALWSPWTPPLAYTAAIDGQRRSS